MKMNGFGAAFFVAFCVVLHSVGHACPFFVEFFPDPKDVPDAEGEFVEIRLEGEVDSLQVQMDEKSPLNFKHLKGKRLVLVHDSLYCPKVRDVSCGVLGSISLPNSRESVWRLRSENCIDSILLPSPKPGFSLQRVRLTDKWEFAVPSLGRANPSFEDDVGDCGIGKIEREGPDSDSTWQYTLFLSGCDSSRLFLEWIDLKENVSSRESVSVYGFYRWNSSSSDLWVRGQLPEDDAPLNDSLDTLLLDHGFGFPLAISEIHHCPQEPEPEWVEIYNNSATKLPLSKFHFCNRGGVWNAKGTTNADSLEPHESFILSKDTTALREILGFKDVHLVQESFGYLNNTSGCLSVCQGGTVVDSVCWDKKTVNCPAGFNPMTQKAEYTPGFIRTSKGNGAESPFYFRLSSRILRQGGNPLRVYVEGESSVKIRLLDSAGRERWRENIPPAFNGWMTVPIEGLSIGVSYVSLSAGKFENSVGILVRP